MPTTSPMKGKFYKHKDGFIVICTFVASAKLEGAVVKSSNQNIKMGAIIRRPIGDFSEIHDKIFA